MRIVATGLQALVAVALAGLAFTASAAPGRPDGYHAASQRVGHHRHHHHRHHHHRVVR